MDIKIKGMIDTERFWRMLHGEVFIWHIQKHIDNKLGLNQFSESHPKIPLGKVGCKICGKTAQQIFEEEKEEYYRG